MRLDRSQHIALVEEFDCRGDPVLRRARRAVLQLLRSCEAAFDRTHYRPGHVTASAIVAPPDGGRVALVRHERLGGWLQPGGHLEDGDGHARRAAAREVREETGLVVTDRGAPLVGIHVHRIPPARGEPAHRHYDLCFLFRATGETFASPEGIPCIWADDDALDRHAVDGPLRSSIRRARLALGVTSRPAFTSDR